MSKTKQVVIKTAKKMIRVLFGFKMFVGKKRCVNKTNIQISDSSRVIKLNSIKKSKQTEWVCAVIGAVYKRKIHGRRGMENHLFAIETIITSE